MGSVCQLQIADLEEDIEELKEEHKAEIGIMQQTILSVSVK